MIGRKLSRYKILEKLGSGGMGVVYKAQDQKLERIVAIKLLPPQIANNDNERERFLVEAKATAALHHPNIATLFTIEEAEDEIFIVIEFIEGKDLQQILEEAQGTPMPFDKILKYANQICDGLQAAHEKGIVHRDIKPANIMVTKKDQIKIMDFGLAKRAGGELLTMAGQTLGTVAYMSPEQTRGGAVDNRSDIWAFGIILYEMIAGERPFKGHYEQAIIYSILNEEPPPLASLRSEIPPELDKIVQKSMKKNVEERYQNAAEILEDLRLFREGEKTVVSQKEDKALEELEGKSVPEGEKTASLKPSEKTSIKFAKKNLFIAGMLFTFVLAVILIAYFNVNRSGQPVSNPPQVLQDKPVPSEVKKDNVEKIQSGVSQSESVHSEIIKELSGITETQSFMKKLNQYRQSMKISVGNKNDFDSPEGCYIFVVDKIRVSAVLIFKDNKYKNISSGNILASLQEKYPGKTAIWVKDLSR